MTHPERAARRQAIAEYVRQTKCTVDEAATIFGVTVSTVAGACRAHGVKPAAKSRGLQPNTFKILADLFDATLTVDDIADRRGVTKQRVSQVFVQALKAGIPIPRRTKSPELASRNGTRAGVTA